MVAELVMKRWQWCSRFCGVGQGNGFVVGVGCTAGGVVIGGFVAGGGVAGGSVSGGVVVGYDNDDGVVIEVVGGYDGGSKVMVVLMELMMFFDMVRIVDDDGSNGK